MDVVGFNNMTIENYLILAALKLEKFPKNSRKQLQLAGNVSQKYDISRMLQEMSHKS
jgi:hypothetical protein